MVFLERFVGAALRGRPVFGEIFLRRDSHGGPPLQTCFSSYSCPSRPLSWPCSNRLCGLSCRASCLSCPCRTSLHNSRSIHDRQRDSCLSSSSCMNHLCSNQDSPRRYNNRHQPSFDRPVKGSGPCWRQTPIAATRGA